MKKYIVLSLSILLTACGADELSKLKEEKAALEADMSSIRADIDELDKKIAELDTTTIKKKLAIVSTIPAEVKTFTHYFEVHGNVEADKNISLYPEAQGTIKSIKVKEGDAVKKGQLIAELDTEIIRNNISEVETSLELATTVFERQNRLWAQKIGSEIQYLEAKNNKESLENRLKTLRSQLDLSLIKAPFSGIIDEIFPKVGEMASPQFPMVRLVNLDQVYVKSDVSEAYLSKVKKGDAIQLNFPSLDKEMTSEVSLVGQYINPENRTFKVQVAIDNYDHQIKPNLLAVLKIKDYEKENAIVIPSSIIQQDASGNDYVYVIDRSNGSDMIQKVVIEKGYSYRNATVVLKGLQADSELVYKGARSVQDGEYVKIVS